MRDDMSQSLESGGRGDAGDSDRSVENEATGNLNDGGAAKGGSGSGLDYDPRWWGCFRIGCVVVVVVLVLAGWIAYRVAIDLDPSLGPEASRAKRVAETAVSHASVDPDVASAEVGEVEVDINGTFVRVDVRLKDGTGVGKAADLLASTCQATLKGKYKDYAGQFSIFLKWAVDGDAIAVDVYCQSDLDLFRSHVLRALNTAGEPKSFTGDISAEMGPTVDYGEVVSTPASLSQSGSPHSKKTFTLNGWKVTSSSDDTGDSFATGPFEQIITAGGRTGHVGTVDASLVDGGTSVLLSGLVSDAGDTLSTDMAASIVHDLSDCQGLGLSRLIMDTEPQSPSSRSHQLGFTCQDGTWVPKDDRVLGDSETDVLQRASEL